MRARLASRFCSRPQPSDRSEGSLIQTFLKQQLRQVEVLTSQGKSAVDAIRSIGVTDATYYRWRQEYGGLKVDQVKRLKELEAENTRLRRAVSDLTLEKLVLKEAASGNY